MNTQQIIQSYVADVAKCLPRALRNDVAFELKSLLTEQVDGRATETGVNPDAAAVIRMLQAFGRPEDVAERYRPSGFVIVETTAAPRFVQIAVIGVLLQWVVSGVLYFQAAAAGKGPSTLQLVGEWWLIYGLGALWWPGLLVCCYAIASWLKHRRSAAGEWQPQTNVLDQERINTFGMTALMISCIFGAAYLLVGPAWVAERLMPAGFNTSWAEYADGFRSLWLPLFVGLLVAQILLCAMVVSHGRWTVGTRRSDLALNIGMIVVLVGCGLGGTMFATAESDEAARLALILIALFMMYDVTKRLRHEFSRVRMPAMR